MTLRVNPLPIIGTKQRYGDGWIVQFFLGGAQFGLSVEFKTEEAADAHIKEVTSCRKEHS